MIELRVEKSKFTKWTDAKVGSSIDNASGYFSFSSPDVTARADDAVQVYVDGEKQLTGFVENMNGSSSADGRTFSISGRDLVADLLDSSLPDGAKNFRSGSRIEDIINKVLKELKLSMKLINKAGKIEPFKSFEIVAGEAGANAFEFISGFLKKRALFLNSDGNGDLVLYSLSGDIVPEFRFTNAKDRNNGVISTSLDLNYSQRFNSICCKSQCQVSGAIDKASVFRKGKAVDGDIRETRYYEFIAEESMSSGECLARCKKDANLRRVKGMIYSVVFAGHSQDGKVFKKGVGARVEDDDLMVYGTFLIKSVEFSDSASGETTTIGMTFPDAYSLEAEITAKSQKKIDLNNFLAKKK